MPLIYFPNQDSNLSDIIDRNSDISALLNASNYSTCDILKAHSPYCFDEKNHPSDARHITKILGQLPLNQKQSLTCTIDAIGDQSILLATFIEKQISNINLQNIGAGLGGSATSAGTRLTLFQEALIRYQNSLIKLNDLSRIKYPNRSHHSAKLIATQNVKTAYANLQAKFAVELKMTIASSNNKNRGNALQSEKRGVTLAQRRRGRSLYVSNAHEARKLANMSKILSNASTKLVILDGAIRTRDVLKIKSAGGNWKNEAVIEATSFGASVGVGALTAKATIGALAAIGLGLTPAGWVIMIGIAATVAITSSNLADKRMKSVTRSLIN